MIEKSKKRRYDFARRLETRLKKYIGHAPFNVYCVQFTACPLDNYLAFKQAYCKQFKDHPTVVVLEPNDYSVGFHAHLLTRHILPFNLEGYAINKGRDGTGDFSKISNYFSKDLDRPLSTNTEINRQAVWHSTAYNKGITLDPIVTPTTTQHTGEELAKDHSKKVREAYRLLETLPPVFRTTDGLIFRPVLITTTRLGVALAEDAMVERSTRNAETTESIPIIDTDVLFNKT